MLEMSKFYGAICSGVPLTPHSKGGTRPFVSSLVHAYAMKRDDSRTRAYESPSGTSGHAVTVPHSL